MKKLFSFTALCLCLCLCASCTGADNDASTTSGNVTYAEDTNVAHTPNGTVTLEPLSPDKTQAPAVTVSTNLSSDTILVAGICEGDSVLNINGKYTKDLSIKSDGVNFVFSVTVPDGESDTLSITAKTDGKEESRASSFTVSFDANAEDKELFVTRDSRIIQNSVLDDYYRTNQFSRNEQRLIKKLATERVEQAKKAAGKDVEIIYVIVPNPLTIFDDGVPSDMKDNIQSGDSRLSQAVKTLSSVNGVTVLNLTSVMKSHKSEKIYYNTDSHWTELGAYYGYAELMKIISEKFPEAKAHPLTDYDIKNVSLTYTDMMTYAKTEDSGMKESAPFLISKYTPLTPYDNAKGEVARIWDYTNTYFAEDYSTTTIENDKLPKGIFLFDSFGLNIVHFVAEHFSSLTCQKIWTYGVDYDLVEEVQPDYIIQLISERTLKQLFVSE